MEKTFLQIAVALACLVPITAGLGGMLHGAAFLHVEGADADSHIRYLSGLLLAIGLGFVSTVPHIERHAARFRLLTFLVFIGGCARLLGIVTAPLPGPAMQAALVMELAVTPLLCLWQHRVAKR